MNPTEQAGQKPAYPNPAATCELRGFHGPFAMDRQNTDKEIATCMICGKRVSTAEHLAAYQIAVFHGLTR